MPADQLPFVDKLELDLILLILIIIARTMAPDNSLTIVKLDASIAPSANANRLSTELAANAISASPVKIMVFMRDLFSIYCTLTFD